MLIINRRKDEKFMIGDEISIIVLSKENKEIRIGIEAPDNIKIEPQELLIQIESESA